MGSLDIWRGSGSKKEQFAPNNTFWVLRRGHTSHTTGSRVDASGRRVQGSETDTWERPGSSCTGYDPFDLRGPQVPVLVLHRQLWVKRSGGLPLRLCTALYHRICGGDLFNLGFQESLPEQTPVGLGAGTREGPKSG